jgi:hypothetical protein
VGLPLRRPPARQGIPRRLYATSILQIPLQCSFLSVRIAMSGSLVQHCFVAPTVLATCGPGHPSESTLTSCRAAMVLLERLQVVHPALLNADTAL